MNSFVVAQTSTNPYPVDTTPDFPGVFDSYDLGLVPFVVGAIIVIIALLVWFFVLNKETKVEGKDIRPTTENMSDTDLDIGKYLAFNSILILVVMFVDLLAFSFIMINPLMSGLIIFSASMGAYSFKSWLRDNSRGDLTRQSLEGDYRDKTGAKGTYAFKNIVIHDEYMFTEDDLICVFDEMNSQGLLPEDTNMETFKTLVCGFHTYPVTINGYWEIMIMCNHVKEDAFDFSKGYDYDIHGELEIKVASPELREIATIDKVVDDVYDNYFKVNAYVPVYLAVWEDGYSRDQVEKYTSIDVTSNDIVLGLVKALAVERRAYAGEMNTDRGALLDYAQGDEDFDDTVNSRARKKAIQFVENEDLLNSFDEIKGLISMDFLIVILLLVVVAWGFWQAGYNAHAQELAVGLVGLGGYAKKISVAAGKQKSIPDGLMELHKEGNMFVEQEMKIILEESFVVTEVEGVVDESDSGRRSNTTSDKR